MKSFFHSCQRFIRCRAVILLALLAGFNESNIRAEVSLPHVFGGHMVLQQEKPIIIWGWAAPNEAVKVQLGESAQATQASERGEWKVVLPAMKASGPLKLTVSGINTITFEDVMIGEVWLCSGQSNMEMGIGMVNNAEEEVAKADHPGHSFADGGKSLGTTTADRRDGNLESMHARICC